MLPEDKNKGMEVIQSSTLEPVPTLLGGDATITPQKGAFGKIESYSVTMLKENGDPVTFNISKSQGEDLMEARIAILASEVAQEKIINDEALQALMPTYVAAEYRKRLLILGVPEEEIPKSTTEMINRAMAELEEYQELGRKQIASAAQHIADQILEITSEVFAGNKVRYNALPKEFQNVVKFHLPSFSALAAQHSGISDETLDAQRRALAINLMGQEETRNMILSHLPALAGAGADSIATFFGNLFGTTRGAAEASYNKAKVALRKGR